jgi:hypothetical protein
VTTDTLFWLVWFLVPPAISAIVMYTRPPAWSERRRHRLVWRLGLAVLVAFAVFVLMYVLAILWALYELNT